MIDDIQWEACSEMEQDLDKAVKKEAKARSNMWSTCAKDAVAGSASMGHRFSRLHVKWKPAAVADIEGNSTADHKA